MVIMVRRQPFSLIYDRKIKDHLRAIDAKHHSQIRTTIEQQLRFEPLTETRNRKPLQRPVTFEANWELRFGPDNQFRVFYAVAEEHREVHILAVGVKFGNRLIIGKGEIDL